MRDFLLGTDWGTDCDDAVAVRILCRAAKRNRIRLKGIVINHCMEHSAASMDGFLNCEGVHGIPLGLDKTAVDYGGEETYQKRLAAFAREYPDNAAAEDAVRLYRRILAESEEKLEMVEIGFLQAAAGLLESGADDISPKSGRELVAEKVSKAWVMGGQWDKNPGKEYNFSHTGKACAAAAVFCREMPVPVTFLGLEIGRNVISGGELKRDDVLYRILCDHGSRGGRPSWDPMLAQLALAGQAAEAGYDTVAGTARVDPATGENFFAPSESGRHTYVVKRLPDGEYERRLNLLIG